jgi:pimeloyl-ACP methyl ester carboxylesterase
VKNVNQHATKFAAVRELELAYTDAGAGPVVLLLHGYPFDKSMWSGQVEALRAAGFRAVAPDMPGMGETKSSGETTTMDEMARCAGGLLDELKTADVVVCGLSMGGYVAFDFVNLFPERVRALVLAGTRAPADNVQEKAARFAQVERLLAAGMKPIADATLSKLLAPRTLAEKPDVVADVRKMILAADPRGAAAAQRGMAARRDYSADLAGINVPTLIIVGRDDPIRPVADAEFMHRGIRNSRPEIIEDAAHMTNLEQGNVFNSALIDFLKLIH